MFKTWREECAICSVIMLDTIFVASQVKNLALHTTDWPRYAEWRKSILISENWILLATMLWVFQWISVNCGGSMAKWFCTSVQTFYSTDSAIIGSRLARRKNFHLSFIEWCGLDSLFLKATSSNVIKGGVLIPLKTVTLQSSEVLRIFTCQTILTCESF